MVDRQVQASATAEWLAGLKPFVNCHTPYGKSNLHQQVQVEGKSQLQKVKDLLEWGADANCAFGPTKMYVTIPQAFKCHLEDLDRVVPRPLP